MSTTVAGSRPIFQLILEVITGGARLSIKGLNTGVYLPQGSLINVNEETRRAVLVKTARVVNKKAAGTGVHIEKGSHVQVGTVFAPEGGGTARAVASITEGDTTDYLVTTGTFPAVGTGVVLYEATGAGTGATNLAAKVLPNGLLHLDAEVGTGNQGISVFKRGTAYKRRIQPHTAAMAAALPQTIQLSTSQ